MRADGGNRNLRLDRRGHSDRKGVTTMSRVAVIGEETRIQSFALAGVVTHRAETDEETHLAWHSLSADVTVVILTPQAADRLAGQLGQRPEVLTVVMPT